MKKPLLSICIPTYNRARYLEWLLERFLEHKQSLYDLEIIISDNCSNDDTEIVANKFKGLLPLRYNRNSENIGVKNIIRLYQLAAGQYVTYLADDDLIDFGALRQSLETLLAHPSTSALFAPWKSINLKSKTLGSAFYSQPHSYEVRKADYLGALDILCRHHIFPEIGIVKQEVAERYVAPHDFAFCFFFWLSQCLRHGSVIFDTNSYYYSVSTHTCDQGRRSQVGADQAMTAWDSYRGGYEFLLACGLKSNKRWNGQTIDFLKNKIDENVLVRMRVAYRMNVLRGCFKGAYLLYMRLYANGVSVEPLIDYEDLCLLAEMDDDANLINSSAVGIPGGVFSRLKKISEVYFPGKFFPLESESTEGRASGVDLCSNKLGAKKSLLAEW